ncbi:hypothetical protein L249_0564 [Ophiocordyceps polyrhachis-furcata BCC 54312]|uniref:Man(5)GlcNAc(2)-PP-dolichol translocation protein RFT1 n=1 Tax=Ophiocordyceps polyrhachis-furcata BCC 54312 TaxID=1330021 RepID=A0A367LEL9_9HYPO|nr:hypothetical protein L249_0564 [Ophiocordyceps polyrhachis-furcata BCC 54312]
MPSPSSSPSSSSSSPPPPPPPPPSASARLRGASVLIALQLASRLTSFLANQLLLIRRVTAPQLGQAAKLDASAQTVLFFARDGLRVAVPRVAADERALSPQALVNLGYLASLLGAALVSVLRLVFSFRDGGGGGGGDGASLAVYAAAAVVELLSEPAFLLMQARLSFGPRAAAESVAGLTRVLVVFLAVSSSRSEDVMPFALGQLAYASSLLVVYAVAARRLAIDFSLLPRRIRRGPSASFVGGGYLYRPAVRLACSVTAQGLVKHLLTQGDTLLVAVLASPTVQGVYALANNYGGLLARLLFQPVEESCRGYFSLLLSPEQQQTTDDAHDEKQKGPDHKALVEARDSLSILTSLYLVLSSVVVAIGPFAAPPLLTLVAGHRWSAAGAGSVLATYSLYVPFLAINGLAEAFVASVADERQLHHQSLGMAVFSLVFAAAAFVFMRVFGLGAHGLVIANMINLLCRICWCAVFIKAYFRTRRVDFSLTALLPRYTVGAAVAVGTTLARMHVLDGAESEPVLTLATIAAWTVPFLAIVLFFERSLLWQCLHSIRGQEAVKR